MKNLEKNLYSIVLAGHGSRDQEGISEFEQLAKLLQDEAENLEIAVNYGYLEFAKPTIYESVRQSIANGAKRIVMVPALLAAASHAKNDMPSQLNVLKKEFPEVEMHFGAVMDLHPLLLRLSQQRIVEAETQSKKVVKRSDTCLVVVGRGTTDPDANSEISKLTRMLEEGLGFGTAFTCYSGTAKPLVFDGLQAAVKLQHKRIIVFPYFLFNGVLVKRIYEAVDLIQARYPDLEILKAKYLGVHKDLAQVFIERAQEGIEGRAHMNCSLCKYRIQIVGYENQLGTPQTSQHVQSAENLEQTNEQRPRIWQSYKPHPIEEESMRYIAECRDWSNIPPENLELLKRLVHTSGDPNIVEDMFTSVGAIEIGMRSLLRCRRIVTDVTMVESGLKKSLLEELGIETWCGVHERESILLAENSNITRSAAGIRRAWQKFGNELILCIGDAPTAVNETIRLIKEYGWRPQLVIALPVGFIGTRECKEELKRCLHVPRITNSGTRGGSPWAAAVVNSLMINAVNYLAKL